MKKQNLMQESRTARFDLPVRHPALWRFVADQLLGPAKRLHKYRQLSVHMLEDTLDELNRGSCQ